MNDSRLLTGKLLYGALFVIVLPLLLICWAIILDNELDWPLPAWPFVGLAVGAAGAMLMLGGMWELYRYGHGLPMNAYPPQNYVTRGLYAWFAHPIYLGAILLAAGISLWVQSSSGLYIVTPIVALMALALLTGYERLAIRRRFGKMVETHQPLFSWPISRRSQATLVKRLAMALAIFVPWFAVGYLLDIARCPTTCPGLFLQVGDGEPLQFVLRLLWFAPYLFLLIRLFLARSQSKLLSAVIAASLATGLGLYAYLVFPIFVPGLFENVAGIILNFGLVLAALNYAAIWRWLQRWCEWVANSRRDWYFFNGSFRIINHSLYAGLAGAVGVGIVGYITGSWAVSMLLLVSTVVGASVFAQAWWGSQALLRPFGYWGAIIGGIIAILLAVGLFGQSLAVVALAGVLCASFVQALGRLRCLVQGCCHGVATDQRFGIRVWQPQSRVCTLSSSRGRWILITQLYSILFNLLLELLLWA